MTKVKICGVTNWEDALASCEAGADAIGFNFADEARPRNRYIEPEEARRILRDLPPFVTSVAVCVNEDKSRIADYLEFIDCVQLHGEESVAYAAPLGHRAIKAFRTGPGFSVEQLMAYDNRAWLVDAWHPNARGGTGQHADWAAARDAVSTGKPVILAGGLNPDNVAAAIEAVRPYAVDTASGVESAPGKKDHERIRRFIDHAREASLS